LALAADSGAPLALAVVPATLDAAATTQIAAADGVAVLQHGYAHHNHAGADARKTELGPERPAAEALDELARGRRRLVAAFGQRALPVLVPPWNRIDAGIVAGLVGAGFRGLSTYAPRPDARPVPGLVQVNSHVDIIAWRTTRGFVGVETALGLALAHLRARRRGIVDDDEPTGLLSHHLVHDAAAWEFIAAFVETTRAHAGARWLGADQAFGPGPRQEAGP
ncbi:MAG: polysaccharide deacetylase family protein, partial [Alphaproteobacteria bacterium]